MLLLKKKCLEVVGGDCDTAIGSFAVLENDLIKLKAQLFSNDGKKNFNFSVIGNKNDYLKIGKIVGKKILELAGEDFKK